MENVYVLQVIRVTLVLRLHRWDLQAEKPKVFSLPETTITVLLEVTGGNLGIVNFVIQNARVVIKMDVRCV